MARIDRYRLRRLDAVAKASADLQGLFKGLRAPAAMVLRDYAAEQRNARKRRAALKKRAASVFARMLQRYAKAIKALRAKEAAYNDSIGGDDKLEALEHWNGPADLGPEFRELLSNMTEDPPPTATEFAAALRSAIEQPDEVEDYAGNVATVRKRLARRKGVKRG